MSVYGLSSAFKFCVHHDKSIKIMLLEGNRNSYYIYWCMTRVRGFMITPNVKELYLRHLVDSTSKSDYLIFENSQSVNI